MSTTRLVRLPEATAALLPNGRGTMIPAGYYPVAELDGTTADGTAGQPLYLERGDGLIAVDASNLRHVRTDNGYGAAAERARAVQQRLHDLAAALDFLDSAQRRIERHDLPTTKLMADAVKSSLQDAVKHTEESLDRLNKEAARLFEEGTR